MTQTWIEAGGARLPVYTLDTLVIGSGCAGYNAADWLHDLGRRDIAILTDGKDRGASRNAGSDKQTYYKLALGGDTPDCVSAMAADLFAGGGMHGDHALIMAACSAKCFYKLANLGVPFPTNQYGEYVGYRTDHDQTQRATSAGPLTSKYMTEALEQSAAAKGIHLFDNMMALRLLVRDNVLHGVLALDLSRLESKTFGLTLFSINHAILATGGPAGVYHRSVYPHSQAGMTGMALEAGAGADNLMSWQYGLASTKFRWNVSGTYQQVIPRYVSMDEAGYMREFLPAQDLDVVFLKGYEWPFDPAKPSSRVDWLVYREIHEKGRRVFLDFRSDPTGLDFKSLSGETRQYLECSGALLSTPIARLEKMNPQAVALYLANGIDLRREPLEIDVCAQHCNGGVAVDADWQSGVRGLYTVGEAAGTFGSRRPGGAALNAAQVGSMRAAQHIARQKTAAPSTYHEDMARGAAQLLSYIKAALGRKGEYPAQIIARIQREFSARCAHVREPDRFDSMYQSRIADLEGYFDRCAITETAQIPALFLARDILITQAAMLSAMRTGEGGGIVHTRMQDGEFVSSRIPERPICARKTWFETVWEEYKK